MNSWHLFAVNAVAGLAAVGDQVMGTGIVQQAGPWAAIGVVIANTLAHAFVASQQPAK